MAIISCLTKLCPIEPKGHHARHLNSLAGLICGIIRSKSVQLPQIAGKLPAGAGGYSNCLSKPESRVKRFYRWLKNEEVTHEIYFLPFVQQILSAFAQGTLVLLIGA